MLTDAAGAASHAQIHAETVDDLDSLLLQPRTETQAETQAETAGTCSSGRLAVEATRIETQALEIMRVGYGGFDSYSE